jgi:subtilisin family serine protease
MKAFSVIIIIGICLSSLNSEKQERRLKSSNDHNLLDIKRSCSDNKRKMYTDDQSYTVRYKSGQIDEIGLLSHWNQVKKMHDLTMADRFLWHPVVFTGYQLPGNIKQETLDYVRSLPGVHSVSRSKRFIAHGTPSWGLDRIDQKELPLDGFYKPDYDGENVNVFVVDSGLDTQHSQFESSKRVVRNLYDGYTYDNVLQPNNDGVGHGTHCAGTIGGNTVGVSPLTNIYGVRVLTAQGSGSDLDIINGLAFVFDWYLSNGKPPSIISMRYIYMYTYVYMYTQINVYIYI